MSARYAVYYVPAAADPLGRRAAAWLGRDAFTGERLARPALPGLDDLDLDAVTEDPRGYGFHATLKAPFELAEETGEAELLAFAEAFAGARASFEAPLAPARLKRFLALRLAQPCPQMDALHRACVEDFDRFRAPLSDFDLARRRKAPLTPEQDARLTAWGYPYVFEDFRFHMTLTGGVGEDAVAERLLAAFQGYFGDVAPHRFDGVAIFRQDGRHAPFRVLERFGFGAADAPMTVIPGLAPGIH
jgi:putative phosphonate metabolism protein